MTNDTSTLNGALTELGELMADNLVTMGVSDADASNGLTTLANKILDISPTPVTQTLLLTSDKTVLSYANSDTMTLTATLSGGTVSGQTIEFFKGSTSLGTATTDSNGVATKSYSSTGSGDVVFSATKSAISSNTVAIEDCLQYIDGSDATPISNALTSYSLKPMTSITPTLSSDGTKITISAPNSTNGWQRGNLSFLDGLNNFKISMIGKGSAFGFELADSTYLYLFTTESRWITTRVNADTWNGASLVTLDTSSEYKMEMSVSGANVTLKLASLDGTVLVNTSKTMTAQMSYFGLCWLKNQTSTLRELKVKAL